MYFQYPLQILNRDYFTVAYLGKWLLTYEIVIESGEYSQWLSK